MNTYKTVPASAERDFASRGVPIILGIGVAALFILPNLSGTSQNDQGDNVTEHGSFGDVRHIMSLGGYEWAYMLAFIGLITAAAAAYFLPQPNNTLPRKAIITVGSLLGLVLPISFAFALPSVADQIANASWFSTGEGSGVSFGDAISLFTFGFYIFIAACIAAVIVGLVSESEYTGPIEAPAWMGTSRIAGTGTSISGAQAAAVAYVRTTSQTRLMNSPSPTAGLVATLPAGQRLKVLADASIEQDPNQNWISVSNEDIRKTGFVEKASTRASS